MDGKKNSSSSASSLSQSKSTSSLTSKELKNNKTIADENHFSIGNSSHADDLNHSPTSEKDETLSTHSHHHTSSNKPTPPPSLISNRSIHPSPIPKPKKPSALASVSSMKSSSSSIPLSIPNSRSSKVINPSGKESHNPSTDHAAILNTSTHSMASSSSVSSSLSSFHPPPSEHAFPPSISFLSKSSLNFDATSAPIPPTQLDRSPSMISLPLVSTLHTDDSSDEDTTSVPLMTLPVTPLREAVSRNSFNSDEELMERSLVAPPLPSSPSPNRTASSQGFVSSSLSSSHPMSTYPPYDVASSLPPILRTAALLTEPPEIPISTMPSPTFPSPPSDLPLATTTTTTTATTTTPAPPTSATLLGKGRYNSLQSTDHLRSFSVSKRASKISAYTMQYRDLSTVPLNDVQPSTHRDLTLQKLSQSIRSLKSMRSTSKESQLEGSMKLRSTKKPRIKVANERATMGWGAFQWYTFMRAVRRWQGAHPFVLWSESVKLMEGRFGTGVASYFILARWVVFLNFVLGIVWLSGMVIGLSDMMIQLPNWAQYDAWAWIGGFFSGTQMWIQTPLFYAFYKPFMLNNTVHMDLAYIGMVLAVIIMSFLFLIVKIRGEYVSKSGLSTGIGVDEVYPFSAVVFASWNHAIDTPHVQSNLSFAISTVLKTLISRFELSHVGHGMTWQDQVDLFFRRWCSNLVCTICLGGAGLVIYDSVRACQSITNSFLYRWVAIFTQKEVIQCASSQQPTPFAPYLVTVFNVVLPGIFSSIAKFEKYKDPQWETRATLARSYLIKIASIYLMLFSLSGLVLDTSDTTFCWEHEVAKRFYSLQWLDLFLTCITTVLSAVFVKSIWGTYEFDITSNILELVYRQSITWIGSIYAPIMPWVGMFSTTVIFFVKKWTVQRYADPPRRIYNSYSQVIWFLLFMFITLILMMVPALFVLTLVQPSKQCGPYRLDPKYEIQFLSGEGAYQVVIKSIANMQDTGLKTTLNAFGSLAVIAPVIGFFMLWVYFLLAVAEKRNKRLRALEEEVLEEREDKRNLIRYYGVQL